MKYILRLLFVVAFVTYAAPTFADFYWGVVDTYDVKVGNTFQVRRHTGSFTGWSRVRWEVTDGMGAIEIVEQDQDRCTIKALYPIEYAKVTCYMYDYNVLNYEEHRINVTSDGQITITASPSGGNVIEGDKVLLSTNYSGTTIYYTLDGSTPTTDSQKYNSATGITITKNCTLKALAVKTNYTPGVLTAYYYISETFTEKTTEGVDLKFLITDKNAKTCEVASYQIGKKNSGSITIPKEARGYKVTGIQKSAFKDWYNITSITIPNTVTTIGENAFWGCNSLLTVQIPNSVAQIGDCAFEACRSLKSVALSESITRLGDYMFEGCKSLSSIVIPNSVQSIGQYAFNECSNLSSVVISNSVTSIDKYAFMGCSSLKSVELPNTVTDIGASAFQDCGSLENITLSNSLKQLDQSIFSGCSSIRTIKGGNNIEYLKGFQLSGTPWAKNLPDGMNFLGKVLFSYKGEMPANTILRIPEGCTQIFNGFSDQNGLAELHIPSSVVSTVLSKNCPNLQKITVDASNLVYDSRNNCNAIINTATNSLIQGCSATTIPSNVTSIGRVSFRGNWAKEEIVIPNQIEEIGDQAFRDCSNVKSILIGKGLRQLNVAAFEELPHLKEITVSASNPYYDSRDNCNAIIEKATNTLVVGCSTTTIPNTVKTIGSCAFYGNGDEDFTSLVIPNSVEEIKSYAFDSLPYLREVSIGANVKTFGNNIFYGCNSLEVIESLNGFPADIDEKVFDSGSEDFSIYDNVTLYVPAGCRNNYRLATGWSNFKNIVEGSLPVGIDDVLTPQPKEEVIYSPTGVRLSAPQRGVNIVNGRKLLVK